MFLVIQYKQAFQQINFSFLLPGWCYTSEDEKVAKHISSETISIHTDTEKIHIM